MDEMEQGEWATQTLRGTRPPAARCAFEAPSAFPRRTAPHLPTVPRQGAAHQSTRSTRSAPDPQQPCLEGSPVDSHPPSTATMQLQQRRGAPGAALCFELAAADPAGALLLGTARQAAPHPHPEHKPHAQQHGLLPAAARPPQTPQVAPSHDAARLNAQLHALQPPAGPFTSSSSSSADQTPAAAGWGQRLRGLALRVGDMTQPSGEAPGDGSWGERTANVLTSLPFLALGWHMHRWVLHQLRGLEGLTLPPRRPSRTTQLPAIPRPSDRPTTRLLLLLHCHIPPRSAPRTAFRSALPTPFCRLCRQRLTPEGRQHALSLMAVGAAATLYHATSGRTRQIARKIDYWTIAVSSVAMVKSVYADRCARAGGGWVLCSGGLGWFQVGGRGCKQSQPCCHLYSTPASNSQLRTSPTAWHSAVLCPAAPACGAPPTCRCSRSRSARLPCPPPTRCSCRRSLHGRLCSTRWVLAEAALMLLGASAV